MKAVEDAAGVEDAVSARIMRLRGSVLGGRGPGASTEEIAEHTRDRPALQFVPATVFAGGRCVQITGGRVVDGRPGPDAPHVVLPQPHSHRRSRSAFAGALAALVVGSIGARLTRSVRRFMTTGSDGGQ